ncbi:MAG: hypothetical protein IPL49_20005 [Saprospirales bacterium]|nr:hypothetical protein [Saprospirales bacterium]MBK8493099.1 hypothetical protein [Saprospirales bacterium]
MNRLFFFALLLALVVQSCQCNKSNDIPDVSRIPVEVKIRRFEKDLFQIDTMQMAAGLDQLEKDYPEFGAIFFGQLLGSKDSLIAPEGHVAYVKGFVTHPAIRHLYDTTQFVYPNLDFLEEQLGQSFRFLKYYFPNSQVPDLTTFVSEYTIASFIYGENSLAVGLDFFLGADYPYAIYNPGNPNFSQYLTRTYNKDHLTAKILMPLVEDLCGNPPGGRLLDFMIHNGKKLYILDHLAPFLSDTVIMEYTSDQLSWCKDNELDIWAHFLQEDLLYSSNWQDIRKLVEYSPASPGMPPEAPGRTANWMGWQVIKEYMRRNPKTTFQELIELQDAQVILDQSKYRPKR